MYKWFYDYITIKKKVNNTNIFLLSKADVSQIKRQEKITILLAALIGAFMVLVLYLPQYFFPIFFPVNKFLLPLLNIPIEFSIVAFLYGMLLVFLEIILLTFLNIYCTHYIAYSIGFINAETKQDDYRKNLLLSIGQEKKNKDIITLGINPYYGLKKSSVFAMNLLFTLKATLSNLFFKIVLQRILGRYAVREVMDMIGIPIFAFWNAWGTKIVLREARIVMMGQNYIDYFKNKLNGFRELTSLEKNILYDTLLYIAISKRDYHKNHYKMSKILLEHFSIEIEDKHNISNNYIDLLTAASTDFKSLNEEVLILGFVLDGSLSLREKMRIKKLNANLCIQKSVNDIELVLANFIYGKGLNF